MSLDDLDIERMKREGMTPKDVDDVARVLSGRTPVCRASYKSKCCLGPVDVYHGRIEGPPDNWSVPVIRVCVACGHTCEGIDITDARPGLRFFPADWRRPEIYHIYAMPSRECECEDERCNVHDVEHETLRGDLYALRRGYGKDELSSLCKACLDAGHMAEWVRPLRWIDTRPEGTES